MNWTDKDIDKLYRTEAKNTSFEYKDSYWKEMEAMLPSNSGKDFLWMATAFVSLGIITLSFLNSNEIVKNDKLTENTVETIALKQNKTPKQQTNNFDASTINESNSSDVVNEKRKSKNTTAQTISQETDSGIKYPTSSRYKNKDVYTTQPEPNQTLSKLDEQFLKPNSIIEKNDLLRNEIKQYQIESISSLLSIKDIEFINQNEDELATPSIIPQSSFRKQFYVQLLGGSSQSMLTTSNELSYNIGGGIGLQINKGRFVFNSGINGIWSFHNNLLLTREAKIYSFGSELVQYEIKYKELFSLEADLSVGYQFSKHIIRIGVRPSYIIGTKAGYREQTQTSETSNNYYGMTQGINRFGIKPMIGYTFLIKTDLSIGFNVGMQIVPLVDEDFISGSNRKLPIDGQIYLRKTLYFRK